MTKEIFNRCTELVERYETERRAKHSFGVYGEAKKICDMMNITGSERENIEVAALLHDIAHDIPLSEQIAIMDEAGVGYDDLINFPSVIHQRTGAVLAKRELPLLSDESYSIIECHTTGRHDMTTAEKIVCLCDYIEPGREYDGCRAVREYFYSKAEKISDTEQLKNVIDCALKKAFRMTLSHLKAKGFPIHPMTSEVYDDLRSE